MRFVSFLRAFLLLTVVAALAACTSSASVEGKPLPSLTFSHLEPVSLPVADIEIKNLYDRNADPEDVAKLFPTPPDVAMERYFENRFQAKGQGGVVMFVIKEASVRQSYIEADSIVLKWGRLGGQDRFDLNLDLAVYINKGADKGRYTHRITIDRYIALPESLTVAQRDAEQLLFIEKVIKELDQTMMVEILPTIQDIR